MVSGQEHDCRQGSLLQAWKLVAGMSFPVFTVGLWNPLSNHSPDDQPNTGLNRNSCRQGEGMEMANQVKALGEPGAGGAGDS